MYYIYRFVISYNLVIFNWQYLIFLLETILQKLCHARVIVLHSSEKKTSCEIVFNLKFVFVLRPRSRNMFRVLHVGARNLFPVGSWPLSITIHHFVAYHI